MLERAETDREITTAAREGIKEQAREVLVERIQEAVKVLREAELAFGVIPEVLQKCLVVTSLGDRKLTALRAEDLGPAEEAARGLIGDLRRHMNYPVRLATRGAA